MKETSISPKNHTVALLLGIFLGWLGVHRFYVGKTGTGVIWLLTFGVLGVGWFVDVVWLLGNVFDDWDGKPLISEKGQKRMREQGRGAEKNAAPEVFCWVFIGIIILMLATFLYRLFFHVDTMSGHGWWYWMGVLAVSLLQPGAIAWIISDKVD